MPCMAATSVRKQNKVGGITAPKIKLYYKAIIINNTWHWLKNRHIDQWNGIESPEINPHLYSQLIFNRGSKHIQQAKDSLFSKWYWENWTDTCREMNLGHLTPHTRINLKWIKHINVRPKTIRTVEENIGSIILDIAHSSILSDISPHTREEKRKQTEYIKLKGFCTAKEP